MRQLTALDQQFLALEDTRHVGHVGALAVLDPSTADFKHSAQEFLDRATAVILHEPAQREGKQQEAEKFTWQKVSLKPVADKPIFRIQPPPYVTPEIVDFVKSQLLAPSC